jgi:OPA family glycerol-3-phosphate transporter-like MFS transporter 1/2
LLTGYISSQGWGAVFIMLMVAAFFSGILLTRLIIAELVEIFGQKPTVPSVDGEFVVIPTVNITGSFLQICYLAPTV